MAKQNTKQTASACQKSGFTRGPWKMASRPSIKSGEISIDDADGDLIAVVIDYWQCDGTRQANARLIAAAPDLLAALENAANVIAALATWQLKGVNRNSNALSMARAAIAKAKGAA